MGVFKSVNDIVAKNKVTAGDFLNKKIYIKSHYAYIANGHNQLIYLTSETVESYEIVMEEHQNSSSYSAARGLTGGVILGPIGLALGAKTPSKNGIYQVAVQFKDGRRSLLELNDNLYKALIKGCFKTSVPINPVASYTGIQERKIFCTNCGEQNAVTDNFCYRCGNRLN